MVEMEASGSTGRFETVSSPESDGFVAGPTYALSLVAGFDAPPFKITTPLRFADLGIWIAPHEIRPWVSRPMRTLLRKHAIVERSSPAPNCAPFSGTLTESRETARGFKCFEAGKVLVYLLIWSE